MYYIKIRGKRYKVEGDTYTPPLPDDVKKTWAKRRGEVVRSGQAPSVRTTSTFHAGRQSLRDQFGGDEAMLNHFAKKYKKETGRSLNANDVYMSQLAEESLDCNAVLTASDGEEKVQKLIKRKQSKEERERNTFVPLAEDLIQDKVIQYRKAGDTASDTELREKIIDKHGQKPL